MISSYRTRAKRDEKRPIERRGGWNRKTIEQHLADGTYRKDRHGPRYDDGPLFRPKPQHLPASKRKVPKKWIRTPMDQWCAENGYWFDIRFAKHVAEFGEKYLRFWEGAQWAGQPFKLLRWQWENVIAPLFGWFYFDEEWNKPCRRFNRAYIEVAKKNGKSPLAAYVGTYMLIADGEAGAKVFSTASTKEQAAIVHDHAVKMIKASPDLRVRCSFNGTTKAVFYEPMQSEYRALASKPDSSEGLNGHCCIIDELHVWRNRDVWNALKGMCASRFDPIVFMITTAGDNPISVCREQHDYAQGVAEGAIHDPGLLPYICAAEPDDDPSKESTWKKANPSLGVIVRKRELRQQYEEAKHVSSTLSAFKRYRLNIWQTGVNQWLHKEHWDACHKSYTPEDLFGETCFAGVDLSKTEDMSAITLVFPWGDDYRQLAWFWLPEDTIQKHKSLIDYQPWIDNGWLEVIPGATIEDAYIERRLLWINEHYDLRTILYDPYRAENMMERLRNTAGLDAQAFAQTFVNFAEPTDEYERLVIQHRMRHNGNGVLTWQAGHVQTKLDVNANQRPAKPSRDDIRKIDGIVAAVMALSPILSGELETPELIFA